MTIKTMENIGFNAGGMALNNSLRKRNVALAYNGSYMKRSHARTLQLSTKLSGYVLYTVL